MAGIGLADLHHRHAVAAAFGREVEVGDLRELPLQQRNEQLVEHLRQHGRLVRGAAGVGAVVDRCVAVGDALDREHGKFGLFVVVAGVVAVGAFQGMGIAAGVVGVGVDVAFEHDFGVGRHLQGQGHGLCHLGAASAQQARELVFREAVRHGHHGAQQGGGVGPERHGHGERLSRLVQGVVAEVQRAPTVRQPAHDELVAIEHLLAVDAEVLARLVRAARDGEAPGDERGHVAGPAVLDGQAGQVDGVPVEHFLLARRLADGAGRHVPQRPEHVPHAGHVAQALGGGGLPQVAQELAELAHFLQAVHAHGVHDAPRRAEQVGQHRDVMPRRMGEQQGRPGVAQDLVAHGGHVEVRRDGLVHAAQRTVVFELGHEVAQVVVHGSRLRRWGCTAGMREWEAAPGLAP